MTCITLVYSSGRRFTLGFLDSLVPQCITTKSVVLSASKIQRKKMINASMRHRNVTFIARPVCTSSSFRYTCGGGVPHCLTDGISSRSSARLSSSLAEDRGCGGGGWVSRKNREPATSSSSSSGQQPESVWFSQLIFVKFNL